MREKPEKILQNSYSVSDPEEIRSKCLIRKAGNTLLFVIVLGVLLISPGLSKAGNFFDYHGVSAFYGDNSLSIVGPDATVDYEWTRISYLLGKDLNSWISFETLFGPGYLETDGFGDSFSVEWRILMDFHYKYLFFKLGGGFSHLFDSENLPDLADTNFYCIISGSAGFRYRFMKKGIETCNIMLGYGIEHISDPRTHADEGDSGWNAGGVILSLNWKF